MEDLIKNSQQFSSELGNLEKWIFTLDEEPSFDELSNEWKDQITFLDKETTKKLKNYKKLFRLSTNKFDQIYKDYHVFKTHENQKKQTKKKLYNLPIKFDKKVFVFIESDYDIAFVMTWKIVIKYFTGISNFKATIWDETLNWSLESIHDINVVSFGIHRIENSETRSKNIIATNNWINTVLKNND